MSDLLTARQMKMAEAAASRAGGVSGLESMERAGIGIVQDLWAVCPELPAKGSAMILCGPGNNGGDGYVVARVLHQRGWRVDVFALGDPANLPPDARTNHDRWAEIGRLRPFEDLIASLPTDPKVTPPDIIVDAIFGIGLTRDLPDGVAHALSDLSDWCDRQTSHPIKVAVDVPSGLCSDSGRIRGGGLKADVTVTFHRPKLGHFLAAGPSVCGVLRCVDIGLAPSATDGCVQLITSKDAQQVASKHGGHKYEHGHALVLAGGTGLGGAARLAARGALRIGAGLVTLAPPPESIAENAARLDAIMLRQIGDAADLANLLSDRRITALCLGPGLGQGRARSLAPVALAEAGRGVVLDADGLSCFGDDPQVVFDLAGPKTVLTPHGGEFRTLFPDIADRMAKASERGPAYSKCDAVRDAATRAGCVVLLKGPDTVIADPTGRCAINAAVYDRSVPWLATAGAGDVLAGLITGLLARGVPAFEAACAAAWMHVDAAHRFGAGLIAEDLPEQIPAVLRGLTDQSRGNRVVPSSIPSA